jgi:two-component system response regulator YesN
LMVIRPDEEMTHEEGDNLSLIEYAITNMTEEVFQDYFNLWHCKDANGYLVFLVSVNSRQLDKSAEDQTKETYRRQLEDYVEELQKKTRIYLKRKVSVVIVNQWSRVSEQIAPMYQTAITGIRKHIGSEYEWFVVVSSDAEVGQTSSLQSLYEPPLLLHLLESGRWEMAEDRLGLIFVELKAMWRESPEYLSEVFFFITGAFMRISHKNGRQLQAMIGDYGKKLQQNRPFYSFDQLRDWVFHVFRLIQKHLQKDPNESEMTVVERIQTYIEQHMDGDASLQAIACHVGLHPAYLSKVYKMETGTGISDYVMKVKMEKAVELLRSKNEKIYNIASQLGYHTPHYFIKVFKKYYGVTPQEFKQSQY